jgi:biotin transporter BioY
LAAGFFPFLIGDGVKGLIAVIIAPRLRRAAADYLEP